MNWEKLNVRKYSSRGATPAFSILATGSIGGLFIDGIHYVGLRKATELAEFSILLAVPVCICAGMLVHHAFVSRFQPMEHSTIKDVQQ